MKTNWILGNEHINDPIGLHFIHFVLEHPVDCIQPTTEFRSFSQMITSRRSTI